MGQLCAVSAGRKGGVSPEGGPLLRGVLAFLNQPEMWCPFVGSTVESEQARHSHANQIPSNWRLGLVLQRLVTATKQQSIPKNTQLPAWGIQFKWRTFGVG